MLSRFLLRLLYLTPLGYLISSINLLNNKVVKGINIDISKYSPIRVSTNPKPNIQLRLNWFINGLLLLIQGFYILLNNIGGDMGGGYALLSFIFGGVSLISSVFPQIQWNRSIFK